MFKKRGVLPGFGLSLGYTLLYLAFLVLLPLSALIWNAAGLGLSEFWRVATDEHAVASSPTQNSTLRAPAGGT